MEKILRKLINSFYFIFLNNGMVILTKGWWIQLLENERKTVQTDHYYKQDSNLYVEASC